MLDGKGVQIQGKLKKSYEKSEEDDRLEGKKEKNHTGIFFQRNNRI